MSHKAASQASGPGRIQNHNCTKQGEYLVDIPTLNFRMCLSCSFVCVHSKCYWCAKQYNNQCLFQLQVMMVQLQKSVYCHFTFVTAISNHPPRCTFCLQRTTCGRTPSDCTVCWPAVMRDHPPSNRNTYGCCSPEYTYSISHKKVKVPYALVRLRYLRGTLEVRLRYA